MFVHADRLPTSPALPRAVITPTPWGVGRMAPYPTTAPAYATATLDPNTQTAVFCDGSGQVMEMPGHGTSTGTVPSTGTSPDGNGTSQDSDTGSDGDQ
ncbi:putative ATP-grasp-modified RiPP [Streptomyces sp. NPDC001982]|uniref:putative ATP-grasp-modified RiPP n=1 Tax=Streptomyces sp. NPDC001982 TaxID=3154405 RepID=UPI00331D9705